MPFPQRRDGRSFAGRAVVLTGASSGIGRELARQLARERARLVLASRDEAVLAAVADDARAAGAECHVVPTDVADEAACRALVERAVGAFGAIDVLLLSAGQDMWARLDELTDLSVIERLMRVNYLGCAWPAAYALPHLKASRGRIVVVSSLTGLTGVPTRTAYCATKHALHGFFDALRIELRGTGVSVTLACPDFVLSEMHRRALGPDGRPLGVSPMQEGRIMTAEVAATKILAAARARRRMTLLSLRGKLGLPFRYVLAAVFDRLAERSIARGH
jgi:short-subunit dehydrogenase